MASKKVEKGTCRVRKQVKKEERRKQSTDKERNKREIREKRINERVR